MLCCAVRYAVCRVQLVFCFVSLAPCLKAHPRSISLIVNMKIRSTGPSYRGCKSRGGLYRRQCHPMSPTCIYSLLRYMGGTAWSCSFADSASPVSLKSNGLFGIHFQACAAAAVCRMHKTLIFLLSCFYFVRILFPACCCCCCCCPSAATTNRLGSPPGVRDRGAGLGRVGQGAGGQAGRRREQGDGGSHGGLLAHRGGVEGPRDSVNKCCLVFHLISVGVDFFCCCCQNTQRTTAGTTVDR